MEKLGFDRFSSNGAKMGTWRKRNCVYPIIKIKVSVPICALGGSIATAKKWFDSNW
jgi:hypothetical protein